MQIKIKLCINVLEITVSHMGLCKNRGLGTITPGLERKICIGFVNIRCCINVYEIRLYLPFFSNTHVIYPACLLTTYIAGKVSPIEILSYTY